MKIFFLSICFMTMALLAKPQIRNPVKWAFAAKKLNDKEAVLFLKAEIQDSWHIYSVNQKEGGPIRTNFKFNSSNDFKLIGKVSEPMPIKRYEKIFDMNVYYFERSVVFAQKVKINVAELVIKGKLEFMACTNKECLSPTEIEFSIPVK